MRPSTLADRPDPIRPGPVHRCRLVMHGQVQVQVHRQANITVPGQRRGDRVEQLELFLRMRRCHHPVRCRLMRPVPIHSNPSSTAQSTLPHGCRRNSLRTLEFRRFQGPFPNPRVASSNPVGSNSAEASVGASKHRITVSIAHVSLDFTPILPLHRRIVRRWRRCVGARRLTCVHVTRL